MQKQIHLPFFILLLMISFASVNAVLFTPALPDIASFFSVSNDEAQLTVSLYLVGYAVGQLIYGPFANRFGRKPALYGGISLQILSSLLCVAAGKLDFFPLLVVGRFFLALGAGVGLKMTLTLVNESYDHKLASQTISYLMLAFAITPGLSVALGGILNQQYGWMSCFYAGALYGVFLLLLSMRLPETLKTLHYEALQLPHLIQGYKTPFQNRRLVACGFIMGMVSSFVYVFAALAPFIAIDLSAMSSAEYGFANIIPPIGLMVGSVVSARLATSYPLETLIRIGVIITCIGVLSMLACTLAHLPILYSLFCMMVVIYFGTTFIIANASIVAMQHVTDKAHGAAVMSFINMGTATLAVLCVSEFTVTRTLLPTVYIILGLLSIYLYKRIKVSSMSDKHLLSLSKHS